jgi:hypothetical protein
MPKHAHHCCAVTDNDQFQQQGFQAAPARPIIQNQHQWRARQTHNSTAVAAAADDTQTPPAPWHTADDMRGMPAPEAAAADSTTRWLACTYKAGVLGVAAYDRLSNEVSLSGGLREQLQLSVPHQ